MKLLLLPLILVMCWMTSAAQTDDSSTSKPVIAAETEDGITFFTIDDSAQLTRIGGLPAEYVLSTYATGGKGSEITSLVMSKDQQKVAFIVREIDGVKDKRFLIIYDIYRNTSHSVAFPIRDVFSVYWSPDSQMLFVRGTTDYLYNLQQARLLTLNLPTETNHHKWLEDSSGVIYSAEDGLHIIARDDLTQTHLVDTTSYITEMADGFVCKLVWSPFNQRYYYVLNCAEFAGYGGDETLYSVDLNGNVRRESDQSLSQLYPREGYVSFSELFPLMDSTDIYSFIQFYRLDSKPSFRVNRLAHGQFIEIYRMKSGTSVRNPDAALSPDNQKMAVTSPIWQLDDDNRIGFIIVIDLISGEELIDTTFTSDQICQVQWINVDILLFVTCSSIDRSEINEIFHLDLTTKTAVNLTEDIAGNAWIVRQQ
jgi:hypothetical protein